jgi:hypothetical protein
MAQNYTAWPVKADIDERLVSAGLTSRSGTVEAYYLQLVDAVVAELTKKTHRQFLKGSDGEIRYFDGSGTGSQDIDEFVSFSSVNVIGYVGTSLSMTLTNVVSASTETFPKNRLIIFQSSLPQLNLQYLNFFPRGRRNIKVTGQFGYGPYIPDDVWMGVCGRVASILAAEAVQGGTSGRVKKWIEGDAVEELDLSLPGRLLDGTISIEG